MKSPYNQEQYYSPGWRQRAEEIKALDGNACQFCGSHKRLTVHHWRYDEDLDIWDYEDCDLITLCWDCHQNEHYYTSIENGKKDQKYH